MSSKIEEVKLDFDGLNIIVGQSHFSIKPQKNAQRLSFQRIQCFSLSWPGGSTNVKFNYNGNSNVEEVLTISKYVPPPPTSYNQYLSKSHVFSFCLHIFLYVKAFYHLRLLLFLLLPCHHRIQ